MVAGASMPDVPRRANNSSTRAAYGGSMKISVYGPVGTRASALGSAPQITRARSRSPNATRLRSIAIQAARLCSTKTASCAPRESASIANAPVPAKRSRTRSNAAPRASSSEKSAARTRADVGRVAALRGPRNARPRAAPAITRIASSFPPRSSRRPRGRRSNGRSRPRRIGAGRRRRATNTGRWRPCLHSDALASLYPHRALRHDHRQFVRAGRGRCVPGDDGAIASIGDRLAIGQPLRAQRLRVRLFERRRTGRDELLHGGPDIGQRRIARGIIHRAPTEMVKLGDLQLVPGAETVLQPDGVLFRPLRIVERHDALRCPLWPAARFAVDVLRRYLYILIDVDVLRVAHGDLARDHQRLRGAERRDRALIGAILGVGRDLQR